MSALCADDLRRLELRIPSVVFAATDDRGADLTAVRVSEDGKVLADRIDGRALELDPGPHRFRFDRDTGTLAATAETPPGPSSTTVSIVVREGEKNRVVNARLPSGAAPPIVPASPTRPIGWPIYLSGGLTLAAAGAYASFGILGLEERGDLSSCKGTCDPGAVDTAWNHLRVADGFLAATIVGATVSVVLYIIRPKVTKVEVGAGSPSCSLTGRF
jgi:hypothetical protein